jgi:DNA-binding transcriptional MocR family regulator
MSDQPSVVWRVRDAIHDADDLNEGEAHLLRVLAERATDGVTYVGRDELAQDMKVGLDTVSHRMAALRRKGYIRTWQEPGERGQFGRVYKALTEKACPPVASSGKRSDDRLPDRLPHRLPDRLPPAATKEQGEEQIEEPREVNGGAPVEVKERSHLTNQGREQAEKDPFEDLDLESLTPHLREIAERVRDEAPAGDELVAA